MSHRPSASAELLVTFSEKMPLNESCCPLFVYFLFVACYRYINSCESSVSLRRGCDQGYDVKHVFHRLCFYTSDCQIRDTLSHVSDLLTHEELDALEFVHRLETLFPCQSFDTARHLRLQQNR